MIAALVAAAGALLLVYQWRWGRMLWLDEEMIAINIRDRTVRQLAGSLALGQAAPYGWLLLQRAMFVLFGPGERVLRAVPALFGVGLVFAAVWVGQRWMTQAGAIALTFLCAAGQWVTFYALELKHYSADTCFGLVLPALAAWAIEENRILTWWIVAAIAQWFSNGALFVAPACALVMVVSRCASTGPATLRSVATTAVRAAAPGLIWIASFVLNDIVTLGPARSSEFLRHYWADAFPPAGASLAAIVRWVIAQLGPLAVKPGGSGFGVWFWAVAAAGFILARRTSVVTRIMFAIIPVSGLFWAAVRLVPMFERLSLWMVPAAYVGVAFAADAAADTIVHARIHRRWMPTLVALCGAVIVVLLIADVANRGTTYLALSEPEANHEVDDRGAVRWLARQRQPGDVWVTTHNALPAVWWYGGDADPVLEVLLNTDREGCGPSELSAVLRRAGAPRALVYLGFGHEVPTQFDDALVGRLGAIGQIRAYSRFGQSSQALVVDLRDRPSGPISLRELGAPQTAPAVEVSGCIEATAARRW